MELFEPPLFVTLFAAMATFEVAKIAVSRVLKNWRIV